MEEDGEETRRRCEGRGGPEGKTHGARRENSGAGLSPKSARAGTRQRRTGKGRISGGREEPIRIGAKEEEEAKRTADTAGQRRMGVVGWNRRRRGGG